MTTEESKRNARQNASVAFPGDTEMHARVRAHDWSRTPLGAIENWPQSLKTAVAACLDAGFAHYVWWGPDLIQIYNDEAMNILRAKHPAALGQPARECWADIWADVGPLTHSVLATGVSERRENFELLPDRGGPREPAYFDFCHSALRDDEGKIAGLFITAIETTERVRAQAARDESGCWLAQAIDVARLGHWQLDLATRTLTASAQCKRNFGREPEEPFGYEDLLAAIHPDDRERQAAAVAAAVESRSEFHVEYRLLTPAGELRWADVRGQLSANGAKDARLAGVSLDITERKSAEAALHESVERQNFLLALGDVMRAQPSANAMIEAAAQLLGERLDASRILFAEFDEAKGIADIFHGWFADGAQPYPTVMRLEDYDGPIMNDLRAGRTVRIDDVGDPFLDRPDLAGIAELGVKALLSVPLIVDGRLRVNLSVHQHTARHWSVDEVALVQEVAERLWADLVRARTETVLRQSRERLQIALEAGRLGSWQLELSDKTLTCTATCKANFGLASDAELPYKRLAELIHPEHRGRWEQAVETVINQGIEFNAERRWEQAAETAINEGIEFNTECRVIWPNGEAHWVSIHGRVLYRKDGTPFRMVGVTQNITERKRAEIAVAEDLRCTQILHELAAQSTNDRDIHTIYDKILDAAIALTRADTGTVQLYDEETRELVFLSAKNDLQKMIEKFARVNAGSKTSCGIALATGERVFVDFDSNEVEDTDGSLQIHVEHGLLCAQSTPLISRSGKPIGIFSTHWREHHRPSERELRSLDLLARQAADLIEQRQAEQALHESEKREQFMLKLSDALRAEPNADAVARRAIRMLSGQMQLDRCYIASFRLEDDRADITHQAGNDRVPALPDTLRLSDFPEGLRAAFDQTMVVGDDFERPGLSEAERRNSRRLGMRAFIAPTLRKGENNPLWAMVAISARPRRWTRGEVALVENVAERTWAAIERARADAALRDRGAQLQEANRAKDEFLAMLGHELRNPLQPIMTTLELMKRRQPEALAGERAIVGSQVRHLANMVDDLLDVSRIARGKLELKKTSLDVDDVIVRAIETARTTLDEHEQTVERAVADDLMVDGDRRRLVQVVTNLLTNAAKYSPPGRTVHVTAGAEGGEAVIRVRDQGYGIAPE
ncbi:PAS domain-containing protein, partial [Salinisphaera sp.]|uniref:PAS domain-containing protein n=1 Tax=Salinisphaera sp. TaxID=1914330 RepID=UPI002D7819D5